MSQRLIRRVEISPAANEGDRQESGTGLTSDVLELDISHPMRPDQNSFRTKSQPPVEVE